jgi:hypothetical protein
MSHAAWEAFERQHTHVDGIKDAKAKAADLLRAFRVRSDQPGGAQS